MQARRAEFAFNLSICIYSELGGPMLQSLTALEAKRSDILQQFMELGDLRPGSISAVVRRCGKPNCNCAKPNDPGHDPQLRLVRKVNGKSVAESFASPASFRKAQSEVAEFQIGRAHV